jgi:uncharacterized protein (DUF2336 family)
MMIVRDFLRWLDSAPASERAEAAGILARTISKPMRSPSPKT